MKNFLKIAENVNVLPLLHAIQRQPELWNQYTTRTFHQRSAHAGKIIQDILLRYNRFDNGDDFVEKVCSEIAVVNYPSFEKLPQVRGIVFPLMARVEGEHLGRIMIVNLLAGQSVPLHNDIIKEATEQFPNKISPAVYYERYHVVLQTQPGVIFKCGEESVHMKTGEVWWFNNCIDHEVLNHSSDDRIHLIIDIHCSKNDYIPT